MNDNYDLENPAASDAEVFAGKKHAARWAQTFDNRTDTGSVALARRRGYAQDKSEYATALVDQQRQRQQQLILTNRNAMDLHKQQVDLDQKLRIHEDRMASDAAKARAQAGMDATRSELIKAQTSAALAREHAAMQAEKLKADHETVAAQHLAGFAGAMKKGMADGALPGSAAYQRMAVQALIENPGADKALVSQIFGQARIKADPDEVLAQWNDLPDEQKSKSRFFSRADGTIGFSASNETPAEKARATAAAAAPAARALTADDHLLQGYVGQRKSLDSTKPDFKDKAAMLDSFINETKARVDSARGGDTAATTTPSASNHAAPDPSKPTLKFNPKTGRVE